MSKSSPYTFHPFLRVAECNGSRRSVITIQCRETPAFLIDEDGNKYKKTKANDSDSFMAFRKSGDKWYEYTYYLFDPISPKAISIIKQDAQEKYLRDIRSQLEINTRHLTFEQAVRFDALFQSMRTGKPYDDCYQAVLHQFDKE